MTTELVEKFSGIRPSLYTSWVGVWVCINLEQYWSREFHWLSIAEFCRRKFRTQNFRKGNQTSGKSKIPCSEVWRSTPHPWRPPNFRKVWIEFEFELYKRFQSSRSVGWKQLILVADGPVISPEREMSWWSHTCSKYSKHFRRVLDYWMQAATRVKINRMKYPDNARAQFNRLYLSPRRKIDMYSRTKREGSMKKANIPFFGK